MNRLEGVSVKALAAGLVAFIVIGGFAAALFSAGQNVGAEPGALISGPNFAGNYNAGGSLPFGASAVNTFAGIQSVTMSSTTTAVMPGPPPTVVIGNTPPQGAATPAREGQTSFNQPGNGSLIEFSSNVTMESPTPSALASNVVGLAYSVGGYVAYQSTLQDSAYVVIRVPAASYQGVLSQIRGMGNVTGLKSTSNDVTVQYTDLNAMLTSLVTEQHDLLRLINESTSVNSTLAIETQMQRVNSQINSVQSEILQTQRLIAYSTLTVSITKGEAPRVLSMTLSATPKNGVSPVGVTLNAIVSGGQAPYLVNYNFGDGSSQQGQVVVHQFYGAGDYNVTVTVTDSKGNVALASSLIHVSSPPTKVGFGDFGVTLANLLVRVVEGIAEVAVVVLPAVLVLAAVVYPFRRRFKTQKEIRQG